MYFGAPGTNPAGATSVIGQGQASAPVTRSVAGAAEAGSAGAPLFSPMDAFTRAVTTVPGR
eukprot:7165132-Lingulodinium_polyedra.AAC.1